MQLVDGGSEDWVTQTGENDALWEFTEVTRSLLLALDIPKIMAVGLRLDGNPRTIEPALLLSVGVALEDDQKSDAFGTKPPNNNNTTITTTTNNNNSIDPLQRAWRTLLLGPVLFHYDDSAAFIALLQNQEAVRRALAETFGWELDLRYEYAQVIRASGTTPGPLTLLNLQGAVDQAALLVCDVVRHRITSGEWRPQIVGSGRDGCFLVAEGEISEIFRQVRERYEIYWGNTARKEGFHKLLQEVYAKLRQVGLIRGSDRGGNILLLPTIARYAVSYNNNSQQNQVQTITTANTEATDFPLPSVTPFPSKNKIKTVVAATQTQLDFGMDFSNGNSSSNSGAKPNNNNITTANTLPPPSSSSVAGKAIQNTYTAAEVGRMIGQNAKVVIRRIKAGDIEGQKEGANWVIPAAEVERLLTEINKISKMIE